MKYSGHVTLLSTSLQAAAPTFTLLVPEDVECGVSEGGSCLEHLVEVAVHVTLYKQPGGTEPARNVD